MENMSYVLPTGEKINVFDEDERVAHQMEPKYPLRDLLEYYQQAIEQDDIEMLEKEIHRHCLMIAGNNDCERNVSENIEAFLLDKFVNVLDMQVQ